MEEIVETREDSEGQKTLTMYLYGYKKYLMQDPKGLVKFLKRKFKQIPLEITDDPFEMALPSKNEKFEPQVKPIVQASGSTSKKTKQIKITERNKLMNNPITAEMFSENAQRIDVTEEIGYLLYKWANAAKNHRKNLVEYSQKNPGAIKIDDFYKNPAVSWIPGFMKNKMNEHLFRMNAYDNTIDL